MVKIVLVDMDGVIADFEKGFLDGWRERYPNEVYIPLAERKTFYIRDNYPKQLTEKIDTIYYSEGFYLNLSPVDGAVNSLLEMLKAGHEVFICTNPLLQYEHCISEKYRWVDKHLGREWIKRVILTRDKTMIRGDYMIDDNPHMRSLYSDPSWQRVIFDRPYNQDVEGLRMESWHEWRDFIT